MELKSSRKLSLRYRYGLPIAPNGIEIVVKRGFFLFVLLPIAPNGIEIRFRRLSLWSEKLPIVPNGIEIS